MTENESLTATLQNAIECATDDITKEDLEMMVKCLEELQQYRAIGTVKEIKIREAQFARLSEGYLNDLTLLREYQSIGTIEDFKALKDIKQIADNLSEMERIEYKALKEKNEPKKPILNNPKIDEFYVKEAKLCPSCHSYINNYSGDYCRDCGQKLDWRE